MLFAACIILLFHIDLIYTDRLVRESNIRIESPSPTDVNRLV